MKHLAGFVVSRMVVAGSLGGAPHAGADTTSSSMVAQLSAGQTSSEPLSGKAATSISNPSGAGELGQSKDATQRKAAPVVPHVDRLAVRTRQCVELPIQYTARKQGNGITCRYEGTWDANQSCQVGIAVGGSWTRRLVQTCGGDTPAAARAAKAATPAKSGAATARAPENRNPGSLLQSQARPGEPRMGSSDESASQQGTGLARQGTFGGLKPMQSRSARESLLDDSGARSETDATAAGSTLFGANVRQLGLAGDRPGSMTASPPGPHRRAGTRSRADPRFLSARRRNRARRVRGRDRETEGVECQAGGGGRHRRHT